MKLKVASEPDLDKILECQIRAFPNTLSSRLGRRVSHKMLEWYINHPKRFLLWLDENQQCVGFVGGMVSDGSQVHGSASGMIQHSFNEVFLALLLRPWLWVHPELSSRYRLIIKNLYFKLTGYNKSLSERKGVSAIEPHVGLVVIGVHPSEQGKGYGSRLIQAFEEKSRILGYRRLSLSVLADNTQAIRCYENNAWTIAKREGQSVKMCKIIGQ